MGVQEQERDERHRDDPVVAEELAHNTKSALLFVESNSPEVKLPHPGGALGWTP